MSAVLVVDDEAKIRELLVRWLQPAGYEIKEAASAPEALEIVRATGADVVLADISMPGHDGVWLVTMLRAESPQVAIVLATAVNQLPGSVSLQDGVVAHVLKPFHRNRVLDAIEKGLAWRKQASTKTTAASSGNSIGEWLDEGSCGAAGPIAHSQPRPSRVLRFRCRRS